MTLKDFWKSYCNISDAAILIVSLSSLYRKLCLDNYINKEELVKDLRKKLTELHHDEADAVKKRKVFDQNEKKVCSISFFAEINCTSL